MAGQTFSQAFPAAADLVFSATLRAVSESGYSVVAADRSARLISFNTGRSMKSWAGQDLTATVWDQGDASSVVVGGSLAMRGNPFAGGGGQLGAWGEKRILASKLLGRIAELVASASSQDARRDSIRSRECPFCKSNIRADASVCPYCRRESQAWRLHEGHWWTRDDAGQDWWLDDAANRWVQFSLENPTS